MSDTTSILDRIKEEVGAMSQEDIAAAAEKIKAQKAKFREYASGRSLTPEQKEKQKARAKEYMNRPEVKEKMRAYIQRPEVRERMKAKAKANREKQKLILQKAKELGIA